MGEFNYAQILRGRLYPIGTRTIARMGKNRYIIYFPTIPNFLWQELHEKKLKVRVYVELPDEE